MFIDLFMCICQPCLIAPWFAFGRSTGCLIAQKIDLRWSGSFTDAMMPTWRSPLSWIKAWRWGISKACYLALPTLHCPVKLPGALQR